MFDKLTWYGFLLLLALIGAVYFIGVSTDAGALVSAIKSLAYAFSGRDANGQFADYPQGAQQK